MVKLKSKIDLFQILKAMDFPSVLSEMSWKRVSLLLPLSNP
jgi:hypothetical protein